MLILIRQFCSSYKAAIYFVDSGLLFDASSEVCRGEDLALSCGWRGQDQENREVHPLILMVFVVFGCRKHRFTLSSGCMCSFIVFMIFDTHATLSDGQ